MPEQVDIHTDCGALEDEWDALALEMEASPFLRPGWVCAWWRAFGDGPLQVLALRRDHRLAGVLAVSSGGLIRSPTNWHTPVFGPVVADREAARRLIEALYEQGPRRIMLSFLDPAAPGLEELRATAGRYRLAERVVMKSPYVSVEGDWEDYFAGLSSKLRQNIRRRRRRLAERGEVELQVTRGAANLDSLLDEAFEVEASGWKGKEGTAIRSEEGTRRFYQEVAHWAGAAGLLELVLLRVDSRLLAFQYALVANGAYHLVKMGHDARYRSLGAGTVLTSEMLERTFRIGLQSYEFLGGPEPYKLQWATGHRERIEAQAFAPTLRGTAERLIQTRGRALARRALSVRRR